MAKNDDNRASVRLSRAVSDAQSRSGTLLGRLEQFRIASPAPRSRGHIKALGAIPRQTDRAADVPAVTGPKRYLVPAPAMDVRQPATAKAKPLPPVRLRLPTTEPVPPPSVARGEGHVVRRPGAETPQAERDGTDLPSATMSAIDTAADLGGVVRRARRDRHLTQAALAARAGTGRRFVSELEAGKPTLELERLLAVCRALGIALFASAASDDR